MRVGAGREGWSWVTQGGGEDESWGLWKGVGVGGPVNHSVMDHDVSG